MQPLVDGDVLRYEIGFASEKSWQGDGYVPFDHVANLLDMRIANICAITNSTEPPILYLTGKTNFRNDIAKRTPYKARAGNKPWHYKNLTAYMKAKYDVRLQEGLEADDLLAIEATLRPDEVIICTRDKDLKQVPCWHYSWELGNQPEFGPECVDELGRLSLSTNRKKIIGTGMLFFFSQCLTGDAVDSIPGLGGCGPVKAFNTLDGCGSIQEAYKALLEAYRAVYEDNAEVELLEQGRLLWMTRKLHPDGSPVLWELPVFEEGGINKAI